MKKFKLEEVEQVLSQVETIEDTAREQAIEILRQFAEQPEAEKEPKPKKEFVVVVFDETGLLDLSNYTGAVFQLNEGENPAVVLDKLQEACHSFNGTKKGRKNPLTKVSDAVADLSNKFFTEQNIWRKTKEPVYLFVTDNKVKTDGSTRED